MKNREWREGVWWRVLFFSVVDKWVIARWFQLICYVVVLIAGFSYRFSFELIPEALSQMPDMYIPIISESVARIAKTYHFRGGLTGLEKLLLFCWVLTLSALALSLIVALPELWRYPLTDGSNENPAHVVYRSLYQRIYFSWYCPPYVDKETAKKIRENASRRQYKQVSSKRLAELYVEGASSAYLKEVMILGFLILTGMVLFSGVGMFAINPRDAYITAPILIGVKGLLLEEYCFYLGSLFIASISKNKTVRS